MDHEYKVNEDVDWKDSVAGSCEHGNKPSGSTNVFTS
jgi:hypothetical protein